MFRAVGSVLYTDIIVQNEEGLYGFVCHAALCPEKSNRNSQNSIPGSWVASLAAAWKNMWMLAWFWTHWRACDHCVENLFCWKRLLSQTITYRASIKQEFSEPFFFETVFFNLCWNFFSAAQFWRENLSVMAGTWFCSGFFEFKQSLLCFFGCWQACQLFGCTCVCQIKRCGGAFVIGFFLAKESFVRHLKLWLHMWSEQVLASWTCEFHVPAMLVNSEWAMEFPCQPWWHWFMLPTNLTGFINSKAVSWLKWLKEFGQNSVKTWTPPRANFASWCSNLKLNVMSLWFAWNTACWCMWTSHRRPGTSNRCGQASIPKFSPAKTSSLAASLQGEAEHANSNTRKGRNGETNRC